jgi:hypothetical protein
MVAASFVDEYRNEIAEQVCSCCVERLPGGPPCSQLGKRCGVELHLPELIEAIHQVHSGSIEPYLDMNERSICDYCDFRDTDTCPCPMKSLAVLVVQAVETVDERWAGP